MADVTINYEGNAIATMSASGTKTLLTEGKYCTDDIEVVYVSPGGGGGSALSGSFTMASSELSVTISALAGTTLEHFLIKTAGDVNDVKNQGMRGLAFGFVDFDLTCYFDGATGSNGSGWYIHGGLTVSSADFTIDRTTGTVTSQNVNGGGYFPAGLTYVWYAW